MIAILILIAAGAAVNAILLILIRKCERDIESINRQMAITIESG